MPPLTPDQHQRLLDAVEDAYRACPNCGRTTPGLIDYVMALQMAPGEYRHVNPTGAARLEDPDSPPLIQVVPVFCGCGHISLFNVAQLLGGETPGVPNLTAL
jgi:hypothetical protein